MKTIEVHERLDRQMIKDGHNPHRRYLGMSQIHRGEKDIIDSMKQGVELDAYQLRIHGVGYVFERIIKEKLTKAGVMIVDSERELVAGFDNRFRGHTDGDLVDGSVVDVKSTVEEKLKRIEADRRLPNAHYVQAQMYMYHGGYDRAMIVYVARDTGRILVRSVKYDGKTAGFYNEKAKRILSALDGY